MMRIVQVGLGPVGIRLTRLLLDRSLARRKPAASVRIVGGVDPDPEKVGRDLGTLCGLKPIGIKVGKDLKSALRGKRADVALVATVSGLKAIEPQIAELARAGLNVVSTCEELTFPWRTAPRISRRIDAVCKKYAVTCLATGVNPGFMMDLLPCVLTGVSQKVERLVVRRVQDAAARRVPFQKKIGAGLTRVEFRKRKAAGVFGHVGLTESMHMIAHRIGWKLDRVTEVVRPVIARRSIKSGYTPIQPGMVCGIEQTARGFTGRRTVIRLEFRAAVGEPEPKDAIDIFGTPRIRSVIPGGVNGDIATCAVAINAVRWVVAAESGLKTMLDIPAISYSPA